LQAQENSQYFHHYTSPRMPNNGRYL